MSISMHSASAPVFVRMLGNLVQWLDKAEAHAQARKFDSKLFLAMRLAPDMLPLSAQVQIACDAAKYALSRLSGLEAPRFEDNESTLAELRQRVAHTIDYIKSVPASAVDGTEDKPVSVPRRNAEALQFKGEDYLRFMAMPNFWFHVTTTYDLLRHGGVELGKMDYLGAR